MRRGTASGRSLILLREQRNFRRQGPRTNGSQLAPQTIMALESSFPKSVCCFRRPSNSECQSNKIGLYLRLIGIWSHNHKSS
jgi:hypothetical protein